MANEHPFEHLFETLGRPPTAHAESVNRQAYEILTDLLSVPLDRPGRCILLRAPRAGHGKTHLLSRIRHQLGASHEFIPLHASFGCRIDAGSVIDDTLRCLVRQLPASGGLCVLDLVTRRLFASALQPLVGSGEVPCQDREGALSALRLRPIETFDFHHPNAITAHWARENFEVLGQRLSQELCQRGGLQIREVSFWVDALFRFAAAPLEQSNRVSILVEAVHSGSGGGMERLEALLGLVTQLMRVVLVADDLEGFSSDETAALRFAAFIGGLRQSVERLEVVLSLNQDIWDSAFVPRLSGGLADRLSEVVVELEPLGDAEMAALLDARVPGLGEKVLERIDVNKAGAHARGLIRAAGMAWLKASATDKPAVQLTARAPTVSAPIAAPVPAVVATHAAVSHEPETSAVPLSGEGKAENGPDTFAPVVEDPVAREAAGGSWPAPEFSPPPPVELEQVSSSPEVQDPVVGINLKSASDPAPLRSGFGNVEASVAVTPDTSPSGTTSFQFSPTESTSSEPWAKTADAHAHAEPPSTEATATDGSGMPEFTAHSFDAPMPETVPAAVDSPSYPQDPIQAQIPPSQIAPPPFADALARTQASSVPEPQFRAVPEEPVFQPVEEIRPLVPLYQDSPSQFIPVSPEASSTQETPTFPPAVEPVSQAESVPEPPPETVSFESAASADAPPPPIPRNTDRVDDLLRQFRERYGRGSL